MGIELRYRVVDVFSERPLAGNALCVVLDPVAEPVMQALAREVNLSETIFPTVTAPDAYEARIFTPVEELSFAGHPTLGAAWVLGPQRWQQTTPGGTVTVEASDDGAVMHQPPPRLTEVDPEPLATALGVPVEGRAWVGEVLGTRHALVPINARIDRLRPDMLAGADALRAVKATGLVALRAIDSDTVDTRVFVPGIGEDAGTGSAAGMVATVARTTWSTADEVTVRQGDHIERPSRMQVTLGADRVLVGGRVAACAVGTFTL
jgi:trans-2,3-dihydro-3-hydroxyanthranilate isomerase